MKKSRKRKAYLNKWRKANPEKISGYNKKFYELNKLKIRKSQDDYYAANSEQIKAKQKKNRDMVASLFKLAVIQKKNDAKLRLMVQTVAWLARRPS